MTGPDAETAAALPERFAVERDLGRGGMGVVLLAHDRKLDRRVAIKLLTAETSRAVGPERFAREIRLTARLVHPNIVPLFDSGMAAGCLYYVMPFIDGPTLRHRLQQGALPVAEALGIVADVADALAYAHGLGVVHRDVKPENIFSYGGRALLADFGIATTTDRLAAQRTAAGLIIGTPSYMSPEQAAGSVSIDGRSDLYSLGCVMFELLTGEAVFAGAPLAVVAAHLATPPPTVGSRRAGIDQPVDDLIQRLLAKDPDARPRTAGELIAALRSLPPKALAPDPDLAPQGRRATTILVRRPCPEGAVRELEEARSHYLRALHGGAGARPKLEIARIRLEKADTLAPDNPLVLAALGDVIQALGATGASPEQEAQGRAMALWMRAMAIDDSVGEAHTSIGANCLFRDDDFEMAGLELDRGVKLSPHHALGHRHRGSWLLMAGRTAEALRAMHSAVELEPNVAFLQLGVAEALMALGRYTEAVDPLEAALRLAPGYEPALDRLEISCHRAGRHVAAASARRTLLGVRGAGERIAVIDAELAASGWLEARDRDGRRDLALLLEAARGEDPFLPGPGGRPPADRIIAVLAELGEWSRAMDWVEQAYHRRPGRLRRLLAELPCGYLGLARDPRLVPLLRTAGLDDLLFWESRFHRLAALLDDLKHSREGPTE